MLFMIGCISCSANIDSTYIQSTGWIYSNGYRISDFLQFDSSGTYSIRGDTILFQLKPVGIIKACNKRRYDLQITSLDGDQTGYYMDEQEMMH